MSDGTILGLVILGVLLFTGIGIKLYTKKRLEDIDGLGGVVKKGEKEMLILGESDELQEETEEQSEGRKKGGKKKSRRRWFFCLAVSGVLISSTYGELDTHAQSVMDVYLSGDVMLETSKGKAITTQQEAFTFRVTSENENLKVEEEFFSSGADGKIYLGSYTFRKPGTYVLRVEQMGDTSGQYEYDGSTCKVLVLVSEDAQRHLHHTVQYYKDGEEQDGIHFYNRSYGAPQVEIQQEYSAADLHPGEIVTQTVYVKNPTQVRIQGVRIRDYVPAEALYLSHTGSGEYGAIEGKEHVTWYLETLEPGEEQTMTLTFRVNLCLAGDRAKGGQILYEITGDRAAWPTNDPAEPKESAVYGEK